jgi:hypothetical protein
MLNVADVFNERIFGLRNNMIQFSSFPPVVVVVVNDSNGDYYNLAVVVIIIIIVVDDDDNDVSVCICMHMCQRDHTPSYKGDN